MGEVHAVRIRRDGCRSVLTVIDTSSQTVSGVVMEG